MFTAAVICFIAMLISIFLARYFGKKQAATAFLGIIFFFSCAIATGVLSAIFAVTALITFFFS